MTRLTHNQVLEGMVHPLAGDYPDDDTGRMQCLTVIDNKMIEIGSYSLQLSENDRKFISAKIWKSFINSA